MNKKKIKVHFLFFIFKSIEQRLNVMIVLLYYKHWLHLAPDLIVHQKAKLLKSWTLEWPPSQLSMLIQRNRILIWNMRPKWMFKSWQLIAILKFIKSINIFRMQSKRNIRWNISLIVPIKCNFMCVFFLLSNYRLVLRIRCDAEVSQCPLGEKYGCNPENEALELIELSRSLEMKVCFMLQNVLRHAKKSVNSIN